MAWWYVYILECEDSSLYTGITNDLEARLEKHATGAGAKYTTRGVKEIVYTERKRSRSTASKRECEIKKMTRLKKLEMIAKKK